MSDPKSYLSMSVNLNSKHITAEPDIKMNSPVVPRIGKNERLTYDQVGLKCGQKVDSVDLSFVLIYPLRERLCRTWPRHPQFSVNGLGIVSIGLMRPLVLDMIETAARPVFLRKRCRSTKYSFLEFARTQF
jgi:hypothetical protein